MPKNWTLTTKTIINADEEIISTAWEGNPYLGPHLHFHLQLQPMNKAWPVEIEKSESTWYHNMKQQKCNRITHLIITTYHRVNNLRADSLRANLLQADNYRTDSLRTDSLWTNIFQGNMTQLSYSAFHSQTFLLPVFCEKIFIAEVVANLDGLLHD